MNKLNLVYALRDNELVHVSDVERGLKCGCRCPACDGTLVARKGMIKAHHFAHHNSENCAYGCETSLHMAAKDILLHAGKLELPESHILLSGHVREDIWTDGGEIVIDSVELEKKFGSVIPDVIVHSGDKVLFIEIYVTHAIGWEKLKKLKELKIPTIEIDLSDINDSVSKEELENIILHGGFLHRHWVCDPVTEEYLRKRYAMSHKIRVNKDRTIFCPVKQCVVSDDVCFKCEDNYGLDEESFVLCAGKEPVHTVEKPKAIEDVRKAKKSKPIEEIKPEPVAVKKPEKPECELLTERAEQMYLEYKKKNAVNNSLSSVGSTLSQKSISVKTDWKKIAADKTIQSAKDILVKSKHICIPELGNTTINKADFDNPILLLHTDKGDITLVFYFGSYDTMELPDAHPVLGIDLSISHSCVTMKKFEDILIHDITIKHWLR